MFIYKSILFVVHAKTILLKILFLLLPFVGLSQSDHYWSQNFNLGSSLLSGAVVGGKAGVSAVYYNPAQIGHDSTMNFSFSVSLISFQSYKIKNCCPRYIIKHDPSWVEMIIY